jgi:hypothetical protein
MRRPRGAVAGLVMGEFTSAWRGEQGAVVIEEAMQLGMGQELWVEAGSAKEVERDEGLGKKTVPEVEQEVLVCAAEANNEGVLECADGTFGGIVAMDVGQDELEVYIFGAQKAFKIAEHSLSKRWRIGYRPALTNMEWARL